MVMTVCTTQTNTDKPMTNYLKTLTPLLATAPPDRVLDLGCGTGFFLDRIGWPENYYLGIDPSRKMCREFRRKHTEHKIINSDLSSIVEDVRWFNPTLFIGLNAVGDFLTDEDVDIITKSDHFIMFSSGKIENPSNPLYNDLAAQQHRDHIQESLPRT